MMSNLKSYPSYKPSGVEWLGDVPAHWEVRRIKTLFREKDERSSNGHGELLSLTRSQGLIPQTEASNRIASIEDLSNYKVCRPGTLVMNRMQAWSGMFAVPSQEGLISPDYSVFELISESEVKYFERLFKTSLLVGQFAQRSRGIGSGFNRLYTADFGSIPTIVPPLSEQTAIVRYLDHTDELIRRYISSRERLIELLEEYRQAVIHHAVTRGLDPDVRLKPSGVEWLGDMPAHWETKRLKTIGRIRYGLGQPPRELAEGLPLIRATNVDHGRIIDKNLLYIDPLDVPSGRDAILREKEIIVVRSGAYTGDSAIVPKAYDGAITGYDMVVSVTGAQPEFVAMALLCKYVRDDQLIVASTRSAQPHLNAEELGTAILLIPPLHEQAAIVTYLDKATADIDAAIDRAHREIELLGEYRTRLIADVVTGKVDVREAAAELSIV